MKGLLSVNVIWWLTKPVLPISVNDFEKISSHLPKVCLALIFCSSNSSHVFLYLIPVILIEEEISWLDVDDCFIGFHEFTTSEREQIWVLGKILMGLLCCIL